MSTVTATHISPKVYDLARIPFASPPCPGFQLGEVPLSMLDYDQIVTMGTWLESRGDFSRYWVGGERSLWVNEAEGTIADPDDEDSEDDQDGEDW